MSAVADRKIDMSPQSQAFPLWATAFSADLKPGQTLAAFCDGEPIVLFRDADGVARALEDRCPHRRVPLSLGRVLANGLLQCGYHGWTFDGATGRCRDIPNLKEAGDRIPPIYRARTFDVIERGGLVYSREAGSNAPELAPTATFPVRWWGATHVALDHRRYVDAIVDGPDCLFNFRGTRFVDYLLTDPRRSNGKIVFDRHVRWRFMLGGDRMAFGDRTRSEHALIARFSMCGETGETEIVLRDRMHAVLASARVVPLRAGRETTRILWQCGLGSGGGLSSQAYRRLAGTRPILAVSDHIDGERLGQLAVGPSQLFRMANERPQPKE